MTKAKSKTRTKSMIPEKISPAYAPLCQMPVPANARETLGVLLTINAKFAPDELREIETLAEAGLEPDFLHESPSVANLLDHLRDIYERAYGLADPTFRFGADDMRTCRLFNRIARKMSRIIEAEEAR